MILLEYSPYKKFEKEELTLRDQLAIDRTILANERTFLAYLRTGFTMIVAGLTLIKFFTEIVYIISGTFLVPIGVIIMLLGLRRYFDMNSGLDFLES